MTPPLFADENFDFPVVQGLIELGYDVITMVDLNAANRGLSDDLVLRMATDLDRAVLTINRRDFIRLHRKDNRHAGIIACTRNPNVPAFVKAIDQVLRDTDDCSGRLLRVYRPDK
ncbi:DUF5615 family PIN-like protein [Neolewinella sp.]|uniref:DUF5615 family PIN-like protein n=1 Tax=Neolewinella sp. TaxID=2993543 RepID=UPI003B52E704